MKGIIFFGLALTFLSCKQEPVAPLSNSAVEVAPEVALGKKLFEGKGQCYSCHKIDKKVIGPSVIEIAKIYREKEADMVAFLLEEGEPIVDPSQYNAMKTNFAITKKMSTDELKALEAYFYSTLE